MGTWDESFPAPTSPEGKRWREVNKRNGRQDPYGAWVETPAVVIEVAFEIAELAHGGLTLCSIYFSNSGGDEYPALVTIENDMLIRIAEDGTTSSIQINPADWQPFTYGEQEK